MEDLRTFPSDVQDMMGYAIYLAQTGGKHLRARPLRGFAGASVLEVVDDFDGNTYRCVYTVRFPVAIYVLHAFQKKSTHGRSTPRGDVELIRARLVEATSMAAQE